MTPKISVVVPVYNLEFYLERCLSSILAQDFAEPFEAVLVDDGSKDDSPQLLREWAQRHPDRLRVFHKPNGGHGSACNHGIERARGDYVLFLDGDDWLGPAVLREMYEKAIATRADLLIGNLLYHFDDDRTEPFRPMPHIATERAITGEERSRLFRNWPTPCARLYRRSLFEDRDLRFLEGVIHADTNFAPKSYWAARRIHYVNREWYDYDLTRPEQSMKVTTKKVMNIVPVLEDMLAFYQKKGAFERYHDDLEYYTLAHVLSWLPRIGRLGDYPIKDALREIFGVMDRHFPGWIDSAAFRELRPRSKSRLAMKIHRASGYQTLLAKREIKNKLRGLYHRSWRLAQVPVKGVEKMRRQMERVVGEIDAPF